MSQVSGRNGDSYHYGRSSHYFLGYSPVLIWQIASLISTAQITINDNITGCVLTISPWEAGLIAISSLLIYLAFEKNIPFLAWPWLAFSTFNIYKWQLPSLNKMTKLLTQTNAGAVPWIVCGLHIICLVVRIYAIIRVIGWLFNKYVETLVEQSKDEVDEDEIELD